MKNYQYKLQVLNKFITKLKKIQKRKERTTLIRNLHWRNLEKENQNTIKGEKILKRREISRAQATLCMTSFPSLFCPSD